MPEEDLSFPTVRYFEDGRVVTVNTQEEYDALEPGHAAHPDGPFPPTTAPPGQRLGRAATPPPAPPTPPEPPHRPSGRRQSAEQEEEE